MDKTARRITGLGLAFGGIATVYAMNEDVVKAVIALIVALPCLIWGFWPKSRGPRIVLYGQDAFHVKRAGWYPKQAPYFETDVLTIRLVNAPKNRDENSIGKGLGVTFTCEGEGLQLPWIDGRLDYSAQPPQLPQGQLPQLRFDVGIDEWKELSLVVKEPGSQYCYMFNNDSWHHPRMQNPDWKIGLGEYKVLVKAVGVEVNEQFECIFFNPGSGGSLMVKSFGPVPSSSGK